MKFFNLFNVLLVIDGNLGILKLYLFYWNILKLNRKWSEEKLINDVVLNIIINLNYNNKFGDIW